MAPNAIAHQHKTRRLIVGLFVLLFVDVLWVASSEITKYLYQTENFTRPFFATYFKTCLFVVYLIGFLFHRPWREQCVNPHEGTYSRRSVSVDTYDEVEDNISLDSRCLSDPQYERMGHGSDCESEKGSQVSSDGESAKSSPAISIKSVRFNKKMEVRSMPDIEADAAKEARLPYDTWRRLKSRYAIERSLDALPITKVGKLAFTFCFLWFVGNLAYQEALQFTKPGVVNVISSTSALFTLILAGVFPSSATDRFTLSKCCTVLLSIAGVCLVTFVDEQKIELGFPVGVVWAVVGALSYAMYLVFLQRRTASNEDNVDIPMFFGFVGLISMCLLWPGMYILHATKLEPFYPIPTRTQFFVLCLNGFLGTVLSEYLWLWGCFLTNSLIATMSLSLMVPMTVVADAILWKQEYPLALLAGTGLIMLAFVCAALLAHYDNWDPLFSCSRRIVQKLLHIPCCILSHCCRKQTGGGPAGIRLPPAGDRDDRDPLIIN